MWLDWLVAHPTIRNGVAVTITLAIALVWMRSINWMGYRGLIEQKLCRKIIHIGTGPLFVLCWTLFSDAPTARYLAALVPLALTIMFVLVGMGWLKDEALVKSSTRTGDPQELLKGPLYYGIVFVVCTVLFWRNSPVGILALMIMCGGDGLADIIGRRFGTRKLPFNPDKSWAGSAAMLLGSFAFGFGFLWLFNAIGQFQPALNLGMSAGAIAFICLIATLVEALPFQDIDNVTLTVVALILGQWLLS